MSAARRVPECARAIHRAVALALVGSVMAGAAGAEAQTVGTFRWQLQPYCNVVTLAVSQVGGVYRLEGTDDQCGNGSDKASAVGTAFPNPDGTIGFGLTIVATPGGVPVHVDAALAPGGFDGTWKDSAGNSGAFRFTPGAGNGGAARPLPPAAEVPPAIGLRADGGLVAAGTPGAPIPVTGAGNRLMWHGGKAALRAGRALGGEWDDANVGRYSVALGDHTTAQGIASAAFGVGSEATGQGSLATGDRTVASGFAAFSAGEITTASGNGSAAFGLRSLASGELSLSGGSDAVASGHTAMAFGTRVEAFGDGSVVLGSYVAAQAQAPGTFVFGDRSGPLFLRALGPNQFLARATGGVAFYTTAQGAGGVRLAPGGSSWLMLSDARSKENFRDLDGERVLAKIAAMPVREWNYKAQDAAIRHMGPTAQDFHAAFGLGEDPLRIGTGDADGVALAGVQALEARSRRQRHEYAALFARFEALDAVVATLQAELADARAAAAVPRVTRVAEVRRAWEGQEAVPAHGDSRVALSGLDGGLADWMAAVLAAIGIALAWVLAARGPFV